jgi:hypothetical protein
VLYIEAFLLEDKSASTIARGRVFFFRHSFLLITSSLRYTETVLSIVRIGRISKLLPLKYSLTCVY